MSNIYHCVNHGGYGFALDCIECKSLGKAIGFELKNKPSREQARQWLRENISSFPDDVESFIGRDMFHGWRFVSTPDGTIYFSNCIDVGIGAFEFSNIESYA